MNTERVAELNDKLRDKILYGLYYRKNLPESEKKDKIVFSKGVSEMPDRQQMYILNRVRNFNKFNIDNDPHGEHDFGSFVD